LNRTELLRLLPRNKDDVALATALTKLGYPTVEPVLEQLIDWLRTNGSPVDLTLRPFFAALGEPAVPVVRKVLRSRHELHRCTVVAHVVAHWPGHAVALLKPELEMLATGYGFYGTDLVAMQLLAKHNISERAWLAEWAEFKVKRLRELLTGAEELHNFLKGEMSGRADR
jgi:hypothetical protein